MRIPRAVKLYKEALPHAFPGLTISNDLSNRTSVVSASTSWTIWHDPVTGKMKRSSAADALLWAPGQQRLSLTVLANHTVDKVNLDQNLKANGVRFSPTLSRDSKQQYVVKAAKSVILAAGTLATAPILERSGVGKASILSAAKVKQLVDLPGVGTNLNVCQLVLLFPSKPFLPCKRNTKSPYGPSGSTRLGDICPRQGGVPKRYVAH